MLIELHSPSRLLERSRTALLTVEDGVPEITRPRDKFFQKTVDTPEWLFHIYREGRSEKEKNAATQYENPKFMRKHVRLIH